MPVIGRRVCPAWKHEMLYRKIKTPPSPLQPNILRKTTNSTDGGELFCNNHLPSPGNLGNSSPAGNKAITLARYKG
ncbi:unnamed protein product [Cyprideis torosa]|uniref:Uncharacterized protein n=1 Tax=Cyprideis torosa TaxID=163714 RepID=A0A7R8WJE0_9CRUS|nr:unnamed protein product [Cyprideis torosa]CAG0895858.1 unnamed protein product [Cyprideis torosa]